MATVSWEVGMTTTGSEKRRADGWEEGKAGGGGGIGKNIMEKKKGEKEGKDGEKE